MFRNLTLQRAVASVLIASIYTGLIAPAAAQSRAAVPMVGNTPLVPLQAPERVKPGVDANGVPTGKGVRRALPAGKALATAAAVQGDAFDALHALARKGRPGAGKADPLALARELKAQYAAVQKVEKDIAGDFAATEKHLRARGVPAEIIKRHQSAVGEFDSRRDGLRGAVSALDAAATPAAAQAAIDKIGKQLDQYPHQPKAHQRAAALPWGQGKRAPMKVSLTPREHEGRFPQSIQLAALGSLSGIDLPDLPLPATVVPGDLAATDDAPATAPEIVALAARLGNNPVAIHNWVRNQIIYTPGFGAMQGALSTLRSGRGNDVDSASLLVALYRAAGIPARYAYGTIEVPQARMQNWLGVDNAQAVVTLLTQAGIPNRVAGQAVQLEHVWVEAFVDAAPSRGAVNKSAGAWMVLDPSFKQMDQQRGLDLRSSVSMNETGLFDAARQGAMCTPDYARNLNLVNLQKGYSDYKAALAATLSREGSDLTLGQVLGGSSVAPENYGILLGSLPYKTVAQGVLLNVLPQQLRWKFRLQLFASAAERESGRGAVALTADLSSVAEQRVTLSFAPATQLDADTLAAYMPRPHADGSPVHPSEFPPAVPGYLVRVKAEIRAGGALVASGGSFVLGSELVADIGAFDPSAGDWTDSTFYPNAGDYHAVAIDAQGVSAERLTTLKASLNAVHAKLAAGQGATLARDDVAGALLYQGALAYFASADANAALFQRAADVVEQRLPSYGRAVAQVRPEMAFGIVRSVSFPGVVLDIDRSSSAVAANAKGIDGGAYVRQSNLRNAVYARQVLSQLFTSAQQPGQAVSPIASIAGAAGAGQPVYQVTSSNSAAVLPQLSLSAAAADDLQNDVARGLQATVAQSAVNVGGWTGHGVAVVDPVTGAASYRLTGEAGTATAALYPAAGMGWLALGEPAVSAAALAPVALAAQAIDATYAAMLGKTGNTTRWSFFPGQAEVGNGLFLARLGAAQGEQPCDNVIALLAANLTGAGGGVSGSVSGAPVITSAPVIQAGAGQNYSYGVLASDPQGGALAYSLVGAPTGMTISETGAITWFKPVAGTYNVTVRADNGKAYAEQRYQLTVSAQALELSATLVATPGVVNIGETVDIQFAVNGGSGNVAVNVTVDGEQVAVDGSGRASVTATVKGAHQISATATDAVGKVTRAATYSVRDLADSTLPVALITAPADDAEVTAPVNVIGTASATSMAYYQLMLRPAGNTTWNEIARGTTAVNAGVLGKLDPTQLANGIYEMVLVVTDANGNKQSSFRTVDIYRDLKIGQFAISFEDLNVEASGIPIRVTRTYDTRKKAEDLDFGYGWSVDYQDVQLRKNMVLGLQWIIERRQLSLCLVPTGKRKINIALPDGNVHRFTAANSTECSLAQIPPVDIRMTPLPGTTSRLEIINIPAIQARGNELYDFDNFEPWNPKEFKLTTEDKYEYYLQEGVGITRVKDPSGNILTYGQNGIVHSNGQSVAFQRDGAGRITVITDPAGKRIRYGYSAAGDLISVTDRADAVTKLSYNRSHGLTNYTDALGNLTARYVYDDEGRVIAVYDAEGNAIETVHDTANNIEVVKDRRGNVTTYRYDSAGNVVEKIDALKNKTGYGYDALGNVTVVTDALGKSTTSTFDPRSGKQLTEKDAVGNVRRWAYDSDGVELANSTDPRGHVTAYASLSNGGQSLNEPLGRSSTAAVDSAGNMTRLTVAGRDLTMTYDAKGNKLTETDAAGNVVSYAYDANGKEISRSWTRTIDGVVKSFSTTRKLDAEGRPLEVTDALGFVTKNAYNAGGQLVAATDPQGRVTKYEYNARGRLAKTVYPDGASESVQYDAEGNESVSTDRQGRQTRFEYDALNRLTRTIGPDGVALGIEYDEAGRIKATVDGDQRRTVNTYDDIGRLETSTDPEQKLTRYGYDASSNLTSVIDGNLQLTKYEYDALNRLVLTTAPDLRTASVVWNVDGTKRSETDFGGTTVAYGYDTMGRLASVTQTDGATQLVTGFQYNELGDKASQTDAEGRTTKWHYDGARYLAGRTLPGGQTERFVHDSVGNRTSRVDFGGQTTRQVFDSVGQVIQIIRPDGVSVSNTYTLAGRLESSTVAGNRGIRSGVTRYSYDASDRLVRQVNPDASFLAYAYDANGNVTERSTAAGTVAYGYDKNQRLTSVTGIDGKTTTYTLTATGKIATAAMPNGTTSHFAYDDAARLKQVIHKRGDGRIATGVRYELLDNGQRKSVAEFDEQSVMQGDVATNPARTSQYQYDGAARLTQEDITLRGGVVELTNNYTYDKVGNRTKKVSSTPALTEITSYVYDPNDRLTLDTKTSGGSGATEIAYTWDADGRLKTKTGGGVTEFFEWSSDNRLLGVKKGATKETAQAVADYTYDAQGNRVGKTVPSVDGQSEIVTRYLVDSSFPVAQVVEEVVTQAGASEKTSFLWGNGLIQQSRGAQAAFHHTDGLGSIKALTDPSGAVSNSVSYDAFGIVQQRSGQASTVYGYAGEHGDETTGLQFNRERWYDSATGRFISMDQHPGDMLSPLTLNDYQYVNGDPVNNTDPTGLFIGMASLSIGNFTQTYGHTKRAHHNFQTFKNITTTLCKTANAIGSNAKHLHHALPKFMGGMDKPKKLLPLPEEMHYALHKLLTFGLLINGFPGPNKNKYQKLFQNPGKKADAMLVLHDVAKFIDSACQPVVKGYDPISPFIDDLIQMGDYVF